MKKVHVALLGLALASGSVMAQEVESTAAPLEIYGVGGTGGLGVGLNFPLTPMFGVRAEIGRLKSSDSYTVDDITYKGDIQLRGDGLFLDIRPTEGSFRLVAGAALGGLNANLGADHPGGQITIDGQTFTANASSLRVSIKYPNAMPYVGVGWGHGRVGVKGWTFGLDLGAAIGSPKVKLTASPDLLAQPGAADRVAAEERRVQDDAKDIRLLPVVKVSFGYQF